MQIFLNKDLIRDKHYDRLVDDDPTNILLEQGLINILSLY